MNFNEKISAPRGYVKYSKSLRFGLRNVGYNYAPKSSAVATFEVIHYYYFLTIKIIYC